MVCTQLTFVAVVSFVGAYLLMSLMWCETYAIAASSKHSAHNNILLQAGPHKHAHVVYASAYQPRKQQQHQQQRSSQKHQRPLQKQRQPPAQQPGIQQHVRRSTFYNKTTVRQQNSSQQQKHQPRKQHYAGNARMAASRGKGRQGTQALRVRGGVHKHGHGGFGQRQQKHQRHLQHQQQQVMMAAPVRMPLAAGHQVKHVLVPVPQTQQQSRKPSGQQQYRGRRGGAGGHRSRGGTRGYVQQGMTHQWSGPAAAAGSGGRAGGRGRRFKQ